MKTLLTLAAAAAVLATSGIAQASYHPGGHWEWQSRTTPGPNKSNLPSRVRVWVNDAPTLAKCDCPMMGDTAMGADCMAMPHKGESPSNG